jgi:elongation factor Tu
MSVKPVAHVCVLGDVGHGKTTLTAALVRVLAGAPPGSMYTERLQSRVEYETHFRRYVHFDHAAERLFPNDNALDGAVLVVGAPDEPGEAALRQAFVARHLGPSALVVFVNRCDLALGAAAIDRAESAARALLCDVGLAGDDAPVVCGAALPALQGASAWEARVRDLADALDRHVPQPALAADLPFRLQIEDVARSRAGPVAIGRIERGQVRVGDMVEYIGLGPRRLVCVRGIETFPRRFDVAKPREVVGLLVREIPFTDLRRGQWLVAPGAEVSTRFRARLGAFDAARAAGRARRGETRREDPATQGPALWNRSGRWRFRVGLADLDGTIAAASDAGELAAGYDATAVATLDAPSALEPGARFLVFDGDTMVGGGSVDEVLE